MVSQEAGSFRRMSDYVYKTIEVTGSSSQSIDDAIRKAIGKAAETVRELDWFEVITIRGHLEEQEVAHFQVTTKIGFRLD